MDYWLHLSLSILIASLILFIFLKTFFTNSKKENSLDSKKKGKTILVIGPNKSGKTLLYQKLADAPKMLATVHSLKANSMTLCNWKLIDLPLDMQSLHSQPADFFKFNDLRSLILCIGSLEKDRELELVISMTIAVGILKNVPLCIYSHNLNLDKSFIIDKLLTTLLSIQKCRLSNAHSTSSSQIISFDDPINRLIFESPDGEVSSDYKTKIREYFDENVCFNTSADTVKDWITTL